MPPLFWPGAIALSLSPGVLVLWLDDAYSACARLSPPAPLPPCKLSILKTRETKAISLGMYLAFGCGVLLWLVYGLKIGDRPVTIANSITLALASTVRVAQAAQRVAYLRFRWKRTAHLVAPTIRNVKLSRPAASRLRTGR